MWLYRVEPWLLYRVESEFQNDAHLCFVPDRTIAVGELSAESVVEADVHYVVGGVMMVMHPKV